MPFRIVAVGQRADSGSHGAERELLTEGEQRYLQKTLIQDGESVYFISYFVCREPWQENSISTNPQLSLSGIAEGIYLIQIINDKFIQTQKIVKE